MVIIHFKISFFIYRDESERTSTTFTLSYNKIVANRKQKQKNEIVTPLTRKIRSVVSLYEEKENGENFKFQNPVTVRIAELTGP